MKADAPGALDLDRHELPDRDSPFSPAVKNADHYRLQQQQGERRLHVRKLALWSTVVSTSPVVSVNRKFITQDLTAQQQRKRQLELARESEEAAARKLQQEKASLAGNSAHDVDSEFEDEGSTSRHQRHITSAADDANPFDGESDATDPGANPFGDDTATETEGEDDDPRSESEDEVEGTRSGDDDLSDGSLSVGGGDDTQAEGGGEDDAPNGNNPFGAESESEDDSKRQAPAGHSPLSRAEVHDNTEDSGAVADNPFGSETETSDGGGDDDDQMSDGGANENDAAGTNSAEATNGGGSNPFGTESESEDARD